MFRQLKKKAKKITGLANNLSSRFFSFFEKIILKKKVAK